MDSVDDLHHAEDVIDGLAAVIRLAISEGSTDRLANSTALALAESYCRPTCRADEEGECVTGEDTCGCPCHERATDDEEPQP